MGYELRFNKGEMYVVRLQFPKKLKKVKSFLKEGEIIPALQDPDNRSTGFSDKWMMITPSYVSAFRIAWHQGVGMIAVKPSKCLPWMFVGRCSNSMSANALAQYFITSVKNAIRCNHCRGNWLDRRIIYIDGMIDTEEIECECCVYGIKEKFSMYFDVY